MSSDFSESFGGPIKNVTIFLAEIYLDETGYREGPKMLSQAISFLPDQNKIEDVTYYGDGIVHSREVREVDAASKSILERYEPDGKLRDTWHIHYDLNGKRIRAEVFCPDDQFMREFQAEDYQRVESFDPDESAEREIDAYGNWIREIRFRTVVETGKVARVPTMATYRTITYFGS